MATTNTEVYSTVDYQPSQLHGVLETKWNIALDSSYPTGGEALVLTTDLGLAATDTVVAVEVAPTLGYGADYLHATSKLVMYGATAGTEVVDTTDLSAVEVTVTVYYTAA